MNGRRFLDTNIVVYSVSVGDRRTRLAGTLVDEGGVVSVQVLNELAVVCRRKLGMSWADVAAVTTAVMATCPDPVPLTAALNATARRHADRYGFAFYDALIVAAALQAGCDVLCTEDLQHGQVIEQRLTVCNPFV